MKIFFYFLYLFLFFSIGVFSQSEKNFDSTIGVADEKQTSFVYDINPKLGGPLLTEGILETTFPDYSGNLHPMSIAFDGSFYYVVGGGTSPGDVALLDGDFNLITTQVVNLDCRSVFYNPNDGNIYIKALTNNGLYRLNTSPFDGGFDVVFTNLFQDPQSKACLSEDGLYLYDHFNGTVLVYEFATGLTVNTITLNLQHNMDWPRGNLLAHTGTYLITFADNVIYAYDPTNGNAISSCALTAMPTSYEWSIAYTNGMFFLTEGTELTWYAWTIDDGAVSVNENESILNEFSLEQNYPNPFNPNTKIKYSVPQSSQVVIKVYDILGNELETLVNEVKPVGTYELTWSAQGLPSGVYFYQLKSENYIETKKMVLMK